MCKAVTVVVRRPSIGVTQHVVGLADERPHPVELRGLEERVHGQRILGVHLQGEAVRPLDLLAGGPGLEAQDVVVVLGIHHLSSPNPGSRP